MELTNEYIAKFVCGYPFVDKEFMDKLPDPVHYTGSICVIQPDRRRNKVVKFHKMSVSVVIEGLIHYAYIWVQEGEHMERYKKEIVR